MLLIAVAALTGTQTPYAAAAPNPPEGISVSASQTKINWEAVKSAGIDFAIANATDGPSYTSPQFNSQYTGATNTGLIRGAYHFARPNASSGAAQANYFLAHGGGWQGDGETLPGTVDLEAAGSDTCYGLSAAAMVNWIKDFSNTYRARADRYPIIHTTTSWWKQCTANDATFGGDNPLSIANYAKTPGALPAGWTSHMFWVYADHRAKVPGEAVQFNGDRGGLERFARG
ncbi:glycosyl hydrolase family 25 [Nocardia pseudobrasiliensis]|uniref:lysozyme n=2 Tax=Nocardia pseudobrasiliensis TaxID=45979 RepID=A0A370I168_9NOCA|nr:glycosyl hydrolase family 25 [Nocardia pseudobrasiliensis]